MRSAGLQEKHQQYVGLFSDRVDAPAFIKDGFHDAGHSTPVKFRFDGVGAHVQCFLERFFCRWIGAPELADLLGGEVGLACRVVDVAAFDEIVEKEAELLVGG